MSGLADLALQEAIFVTLSQDSTLNNLVNGVFDGVPATAQLPYLTIGEITSQDWSTKTFEGQRHSVTIHAYATRESRAGLKDIMTRIYELLHGQNPALNAHRLVTLRFQFSETFLDADRRTVHGVIRFRALTHLDP